MKKFICVLLTALLVFTAIGASALTLKHGSTGQAVVDLQAKLKSLGYYNAAIDGKYDDGTWVAVWQFQRDKGLTADGIAGAKTLAALGLTGATGSITATNLTYGSNGSDVIKLQNALKAKGYYGGNVDGVYGYSTWLAVWNFQKDKGVNASGIADANTLSLLGFSGMYSKVPYGSKGSVVVAIQTKLKALGYYGGNIDGEYGYSTWLAVWNYQRDKGLTADGIAGAQTMSSLGIAPTSSIKVPTKNDLKYGSKGDAVSSLQKALAALGYYGGTIDGKYEYGTWYAVWEFQNNNGLGATGIADKATLNSINSGYAKSK